MYQLTEVTKNYKRGADQVQALRGVDLAIGEGELLAVQGPTGHGKSTLLQLLGGLDRPTSGQLWFDGRDLARMSEGQLTKLRSTRIGFVFQTFNLIQTLTAQENVEAALVPMRISASNRHARAEAALREVGLADRAKHLPSELSGGQQQRVAIARALVKEPSVILADEPTGNLDEDTRDEIIALLENLWQQRGLTVVIVTHDSSIAQRAERVAWIKHGKLTIRKDSPPALKANTAGSAGKADAPGTGDGG